MVKQFVDAPGAESVEPPVPVAQVVRAETPSHQSPAPPLALDLRVLEAVRALAPCGQRYPGGRMLLLPIGACVTFSSSGRTVHPRAH